MAHPRWARLAILLGVSALLAACEAPATGGRNTVRFASGEVYVGDLADGRRSGQGSYSWPDGRRYVGTFRDGLPNGRGTYTFPNGEKYVGEFVDNKRTGKGVYSWPDGRRYEGTFLNDKPDGEGVYSWPDGKRYVGAFRDGQANGRGTYRWPDGRVYAGELRDDLPNGQGSLTLADGRRLAGEFRNGDFVGDGSRPAASPGAGEIALRRHGGTYTVPVLVNGTVALDFYLDSGAADVSLPAHSFEALRKAGSIRPQDMLGTETYLLGSGQSKRAATFVLRSLQVGAIVVENVRCSVSDGDGPPLLGMSFLGRFSSWSVDNDRHVLVLR